MRVDEGMTSKSEDDNSRQPLRVLEFYSGVGGMRYALQLSGLPFTVVEAFDINEVANDVYEHNFGHRPSEGNVSRVKAKELDAYKADMWLMAPPCQPYTRQGLKKDSGDGRASSFLSMLQRIPELQHPPTYLLVENVVGFETSTTHQELLRTLADAGFIVQEFILSPLQFGIPYSRPRYFCLAKSRRLPFLDQSLPGSIIRSPAVLFRAKLLPPTTHSAEQVEISLQRPLQGGSPTQEASQVEGPSQSAPPLEGLSQRERSSESPSASNPLSRSNSENSSDSRSQRSAERESQHLSQAEHQPATDSPSDLDESYPDVRPVSDFLEDSPSASLEPYRVPEAVVSRWGDAFDIVTPLSTRCCCFTKSYVKYAKGTGSILATTPGGVWQDRHVADEKGIVNGGASFDQTGGRLVDLAALNLRFFTPREVANFHSFPPSFSFPGHVTLKQQYALLGNSLSAEVVAYLLNYMSYSHS